MDRTKRYLNNLTEKILKKKLWGAVLIVGFYSLLYPALFSFFSKSSIHFYLIPAALIGFFFGPLWGLIGGLFFWPLHALLHLAIQSPLFALTEDFPNFQLNFWATFITTTVIAVLVGYLQTIQQTLEKEIYARKRISNALRQSESRYRYLLNHSSNIIALFDTTGQIEYITQSAERLVQYPLGEMVGKHFTEFIHPDWRQQVTMFYARQILKKKQKSYHEFPLITKAGKTVWVSHTLELLHDKGEISGGQGILIDITSRQKAQQALAKSEKRFRALTENSSDITIIVDENKTIKYISPSIQHISGYNPEELENQDLRQFIHTDDQNKFIQRFQQAVDNPPETLIRAGALRTAHRDGRWLYYDGLLNNMLDVESVNGIVFNLREITSQVQLEQALWESEYNFRTLFNQAHDAVVILSMDGKIQEFNNRFANLMDQPRDELAGQFFTNFLLKEDVDTFEDHFNRLKIDLQIPLSEITLINSRKEEISFEINLGMVKDSQGAPQKVLGILRDISGQKKTEEKLRFLASHDPLTSLPNRSVFHNRLVNSCQQAMESGYMVVVAFLDCNNFKEINDQYGHHIGDLALTAFSEIIQNSLRAHDTLARFGGDEFT
ncbi:MAG TPA: PAS domain S-box protein, partial [Anaerolineales bacterium]|nr:PAS domain S-box protein [Anaerolineales bacterium]